jgi:nucleoid DNA-binding protein
MATKIEAINAHRPRVALNPTAGLTQLVDFIAMRTGANKGTVQLVLSEVHDAVVFYALQGTPVKIEGLGTYTPNIDLEGTFDLGYRIDAETSKKLNVPGAFSGIIENRDFIGKSSADLIAEWNKGHPTDLVQ